MKRGEEMRAPDPDPEREFEHEHEREAELLSWIFDERERARRPRSALDPGMARELAELERFLALCRSSVQELDAVPNGQRRELVERVLATTTREDLSWRGDLRLMRGFVAGRLRSSRALRVAAASLLLHVLALPVLAWYGWKHLEREAPLVFFEPLRPADPFDESEELVAPIAPEASDPLGSAPDEGDGALYVANSRGWARFQLREGVPALPAPVVEETRAARLLRARVSALAPANAAPIPADVAPSRDASLVERALWCELLLDAHLREPSPPAALDAALRELGGAPLPANAAGLLAASALARAESYGALPAAAVDALWQARADLAGVAGSDELLAPGGDLRRVAPLDPRWIEALTRAAGESLPASLADALRAR